MMALKKISGWLAIALLAALCLSGSVQSQVNYLKTNVAAVGGTTVDTNSGNKSAGTIRAVLATDQPNLTSPLNVSAAQSGVFTVQPGNTANTTAWKVDGSAVTQPVSGTVTANAGSGTQAVSLASLPALATGTNTIGAVTPAAASTGGATGDSYICSAAANQDSRSITAAATTLYSLYVVNTSTSIRWLKVYNKATAATSADTPLLRFGVPPAPAAGGMGGFMCPLPVAGVALGTGLSIRVCTGQADNDATAVTANDITYSDTYK